jgi:hypothetical protein
MSTMATVLLVLAIGAVLWNVAATIAAVRLPSISARQKRLQILLIWLLPIVGAVLAIYFATEVRWTPTPDPPDLAVRSGGDYSATGVDTISHSDGGSH